MTTGPPPLERGPEIVPSASLLRDLAQIALTRRGKAQPELLSADDGSIWVRRTAEILAANITSGRFEVARGFLPGGIDDDGSLLNYAEQILHEVIRESERIAALLRGDHAAWRSVISRLERLAYFWLGPHGREVWAAWEARDAAGQACADIWVLLQEDLYPFDIPFNRWSAAVLSRRLGDLARRRRREARRIVYLLDVICREELHAGSFEESFRDHSFDEWLAQSANREALMQAIGRLDGRMALVVRLWYFAQWPAAEIAAHLGTSVGNVYVLRFRAIAKLRLIVCEHEALGLGDAI